MTLNQLYYFRTVAKLENYHHASEVLFISQPSLSRAIASLEEELGVSLFEKTGRRIVLTKVGKVFLEYVNRILDECDRATNKMQEYATGAGRIEIGYVFPLASHYIPHVVRKFLNKEENKDVTFNFYQNHTPNILRKVKSGDLDVGFGSYVDKENDIEFFPRMLFYNSSFTCSW